MGQGKWVWASAVNGGKIRRVSLPSFVCGFLSVGIERAPFTLILPPDFRKKEKSQGALLVPSVPQVPLT